MRAQSATLYQPPHAQPLLATPYQPQLTQSTTLCQPPQSVLSSTSCQPSASHQSPNPTSTQLVFDEPRCNVPAPALASVPLVVQEAGDGAASSAAQVPAVFTRGITPHAAELDPINWTPVLPSSSVSGLSLLPATHSAGPPTPVTEPRVPFRHRPESLTGICVSWNKGQCSFPSSCRFRHIWLHATSLIWPGIVGRLPRGRSTRP